MGVVTSCPYQVNAIDIKEVFLTKNVAQYSIGINFSHFFLFDTLRIIFWIVLNLLY